MTYLIRSVLLFAVIYCGFPIHAFAGTAASDGEYETLFMQYKSIQHLLENNQYSAPVYIRSGFEENSAEGEVYAVIDHDFKDILTTLNSPGNWCDVLLLHINVKGCDTGFNNKTHRVLALYVGSSSYQTPDEALEMLYQFTTVKSSPDYLHVRLNAGDGPLGTSDYLLTFEAIPNDKSTSIIRFKYSYRYGFIAKLALDGYLATIGRHKVGFTVTNYDKAHNPVYIKGLQGIVERNAMRYFLAIQSFLDSPNMGRELWNNRILRYNDLASRFQLQFVEIREKEYIETKQKEFRNRVASTSALLNLQ